MQNSHPLFSSEIYVINLCANIYKFFILQENFLNFLKYKDNISYCILKFKGKGQNTKERMKIMCETNDGFLISQKDLELRGSGDFFGTMQHGIPDFKIANLFTDMDILKLAQEVAVKIVNKDPKLEKEENRLLKISVKNKFTDRIEI